MKELNSYIYYGPIKLFDSIIVDNIELETKAVSEKKAISNFNSQAKDRLGYAQTAKITIEKKHVFCLGNDKDCSRQSQSRYRYNEETGETEIRTDGGFWIVVDEN